MMGKYSILFVPEYYLTGTNLFKHLNNKETLSIAEQRDIVLTDMFCRHYLQLSNSDLYVSRKGLNSGIGDTSKFFFQVDKTLFDPRRESSYKVDIDSELSNPLNIEALRLLVTDVATGDINFSKEPLTDLKFRYTTAGNHNFLVIGVDDRLVTVMSNQLDVNNKLKVTEILYDILKHGYGFESEIVISYLTITSDAIREEYRRLIYSNEYNCKHIKDVIKKHVVNI